MKAYNFEFILVLIINIQISNAH